jgi:hypothetical protein
VEAFITSVKRIRDLTEDATRPIELHRTAHAFSTGLTEAKELLKTRQPGNPHPLVDLPGFRTTARGQARASIEAHSSSMGVNLPSSDARAGAAFPLQHAAHRVVSSWAIQQPSQRLLSEPKSFSHNQDPEPTSRHLNKADSGV